MNPPPGLDCVENCLACHLRSDSFFCALPQASLGVFNDLKSTEAYHENTVLFAEGQAPNGVFMLCQGQAKVSRVSRGGKTFPPRIVNPGEVLGLNASVTGEPYELTAETTRPSQLNFVKREDFLGFLKEHGDACLHVAQQLSRASQAGYDIVRPLSPMLVLDGFLEVLPDATVAVDQSGTIAQINSQTERLFGYGRDELVGEPLAKLVPMRFRQQHDEDRVTFFRNPRARPMGAVSGIYALRKDGSEFPADICLSTVSTEQGVLVLSAIRDLSGQKKTEEELHNANRELGRRTDQQLWEYRTRLASIVDSSADAIIGKDLDSSITTWNRGAELMYGYTAEEAIGNTVSILFPEDRSDELPMILDKIRRGDKIEHFESIRLTKDGRRLNVSVSVSPIRDMAGDVIGASTIARDITEQKRAEVHLRQSQKMESLGRLAGGVAHDFNNLLMIIRANTDLIATDRPGDHRLLGRLDDVVAASDRGVSLVKQLLSFSRNQMLQPKLLDLNCILEEVARMLPRLIGEDIELFIAQDKPLERIRADESQVFQAIVNLAINARDSMPQGGRLSIDAETIFLDEYYARQHSGVLPGPYVMVAVSDTGTGIPEEVQAKMFDPFFTTKPVGKGTGLGLSVVHGVVHQSGGHLSVYSEPGIGSVIKLYFPVAGGQPEGIKETRPSEKAGTVLLAEDDESLRRIISQVLASSGYTVLEAENGQEALEHAKRHRENIDAVVTDIVMPHMGGLELARKLEHLCPQARMVYMSGYNENMEFVNECTGNGAVFLPKPFPLRELVQKLSQLIRDSRAA